MHLSDEHQHAIDLIEAGENVFLTGPAGTGKSTFLKYLLSALDETVNAVVVAPTGVAALNVGGQTIHSFFRLKPSILTEESIKKVSRNAGYKKLDLLIIDEISMVRADVFKAIDLFLRMNGPSQISAFGGVQVLLIGDLFQLPPVVTYDEKRVFQEMFGSPFFFDTDTYKNAHFEKVELAKIYRQEDPEFISMLNNIRRGDLDRDLMENLNTRCAANFNPDEIAAKNPVILTSKNATADYINKGKIGELPSKEFIYDGAIEGEFKVSKNKLPSPMNLTLKKGAHVMFTKNDSTKRWVNGTAGIVEHIGMDGVKIRVGQQVHTVAREKWETIRYEFNGETEKWEDKVIGSYVQYPLMLAWAITIHKSQGQTLDSCLIDLDGGAFADGQVYVALSRCKSYQDLYLQDPIRVSDIRVNRDVKMFEKNQA